MKKIDFFNKDKKTINRQEINMSSGRKKVNAGSKTPKQPKIAAPPKRRGRRPKKILDTVSSSEESDIVDNVQEQKNQSAVILRLPNIPSKMKVIKKPVDKKVDKYVDTIKNDNDDNESSEGMFKNDIPGDHTCHKCAKNEKSISVLKAKLEKYEKKEKLDKSNKLYTNKLNFICYKTGKKITIKKTNTWCWWDGHPFTNLPCVLPELYHNGEYHVIGCFCSYNCALAWNLFFIKDSKIHHRKSLTYKLYREQYGLKSDEVIEIKEAGPRQILKNFGGEMSIDVYRRSFLVNKEYVVYMPPIKPINMIIEEKNADVHDDQNDNDFVLKRSKPLSKKRSVISSMNMGVGQESP